MCSALVNVAKVWYGYGTGLGRYGTGSAGLGKDVVRRVWHGTCAIVWHGRVYHTLLGVWHGPLCHSMARRLVPYYGTEASPGSEPYP